MQEKGEQTPNFINLTSMTGLGRSCMRDDSIMVEVIIKSINNRGLDVKCRMPRECMIFEHDLINLVGRAIHRGRIDVEVTLTLDTMDHSEALDSPKVAQFLQKMANFQSLYPGLQLLVGIPDILAWISNNKEPDETLGKLKSLLFVAIHNALTDVQQSKNQEGELLGIKILEMLEVCGNLMGTIANRNQTDLHTRFDALKDRVSHLSSAVSLNEERLYQELALLVERSDFKEEIDRLEAHRGHFLSILRTKDVKGRKLDFLCQEMLRECTTLLSKAYDQQVIIHGIDLKAEVERLREQVQNIE